MRLSRTRVFIASSLDGFIAGPNGELDWLPSGPGLEDTFTPFFAQVGAVLMGRRTYDAVCGMGGEWPYGDVPLLVATSRPLTAERPSVRSVRGDIQGLTQAAKEAAEDGDVYVDGGALVRSALDAGLIDEITVAIVPVVLGAGVPLFAGTARRHALELVGSRELGRGLVELRYLSHR